MSLIKIKNDVELKKAQELLQAAGIEMEMATKDISAASPSL